MPRIISLFFIFFFILFFDIRSAQAVEKSNTSDYLVPRLTENHDSICGALLADAKKIFYTDEDFNQAYGLRGYGYSEKGAVLDWEILGGSNLESIDAYGKTYYLGRIRHPGCGGACEAYQPLVSDQPIERQDNTYNDEREADLPPPASYNYMIVKNKEGVPYLIVFGIYGEFKNTLFVYKLDPAAKWKSACEISFEPDESKLENNPDYSVATSSLTDLNEALLGLSRDGGSCGSLNTLARLQQRVPDQMKMVLYRPWALRSSDTYEQTIAQLDTWSLIGISEFNAFQSYKTQLAKTVSDISSFYQRVYGYPAKKADDMALGALQNGVARSFSFGGLNPGFASGEVELRRTILEKRPMSEIKAIQFDASKIDAVDVDQFYVEPASYESILNIAVGYPDALDYLISKEVFVDKPNAFGKTPLMYAAQYNQLKSAKVLLEASANVNAATIKPKNDCYYAIKNINVTPLYYAVRYASSEFIELLLQSGALPSIKTKDRDNKDDEGDDILFWYDIYNDKYAKERNLNIPVEKYQEVKSMLEHPGKYAPVQSASDLISSAEALYQKGKISTAYQKLLLALQIEPDNEKALSDMSLIALKNGNLGVSLEASTKLIKNSKDYKINANAWFNQALACEKNKLTNQQDSGVFYNGNRYCDYGIINPLLKSLIINETDARKNKMIDIFRAGVVPYCEIPYNGKNIKINFMYQTSHGSESGSQMETLYIFHDADLKIQPKDFAWDLNFYDMGRTKPPVKKHVEPALVGSYSLDGKTTLSVLEESEYLQFPYRLGDYVCKDDKSPAVPTQGTK